MEVDRKKDVKNCVKTTCGPSCMIARRQLASSNGICPARPLNLVDKPEMKYFSTYIAPDFPPEARVAGEMGESSKAKSEGAFQ